MNYPKYTKNLDLDTHKNSWCHPRRYKNCFLPMDVVGHSFDMGDNFVNIHPKCTFSEFAQAFCRQLLKVQMDDQVYMHLQIVKHNLNERVEEYYE